LDKFEREGNRSQCSIIEGPQKEKERNELAGEEGGGANHNHQRSCVRLRLSQRKEEEKNGDGQKLRYEKTQEECLLASGRRAALLVSPYENGRTYY